MLSSLVLAFLIPLVKSVPLEPGQPGGPWTEEEIDIVRDKVNRMMECQMEAVEVFTWHTPSYNGQPNASCWTVEGLPDMLDEGDLDEFSRDHEDLGPNAPWSELNQANIRYKWRERGPKNSRLIQLAFHDCLRYEDGTGGCDGCINWAGVGHAFPRGQGIFQEGKNPDLKEHMHNGGKTTNNKLELTARSLELIYTVPNWPPGAKVLPLSLKESGKSRADLWQLAGNVGLENAIINTNANCRTGDGNQDGYTLEDLDTELLMSVMEGLDGCQIKLNRALPFRWGRIDCIPDESAKWTPYAFEATKTEKHSNSYGSGEQALKDLAEVGLNAKESIALMATHGLNQFTFNFDEVTKYKWSGGSKNGSISRMYFKSLNGKTYEPEHCFGCSYKGFHLGDANGDPVDGASFLINCHDYWINPDIGSRAKNGPCHFRFAPGCKPQDNPDLERRVRCFGLKSDGSGEFDHWTHIPGCETAELIQRNGFLVQKGGPPESRNNLCKKKSLTFVMPYELNFVLNFTIGEHHLPTGCGWLESDWWTSKRKKPDPEVSNIEDARLWIGSPGFDGQPPCGANTYAPEGEATTADIVREFAEDHGVWQENFFNGWEKMQQNGYSWWQLTEAPANGHLLSQTEWYVNPFAGCGVPHWAEDTYCDDENNNANCNNFDGGACCNNDYPGWNYYCTACECLQ